MGDMLKGFNLSQAESFKQQIESESSDNSYDDEQVIEFEEPEESI